MGHLAAMDMQGRASPTAVMHWHLRSNHYPPLPVEMIPVALAAVEAANDGDWERLIDLPPGMTDRFDRAATPASFIVESLHLSAFLTTEEDE